MVKDLPDFYSPNAISVQLYPVKNY